MYARTDINLPSHIYVCRPSFKKKKKNQLLGAPPLKIYLKTTNFLKQSSAFWYEKNVANDNPQMFTLVRNHFQNVKTIPMQSNPLTRVDTSVSDKLQKICTYVPYMLVVHVHCCLQLVAPWLH